MKKLNQLGQSLADSTDQQLFEPADTNRSAPVNSLVDELNEIALRCANIASLANMSDDEILGYDEMGLPT